MSLHRVLCDCALPLRSTQHSSGTGNIAVVSLLGALLRHWNERDGSCAGDRAQWCAPTLFLTKGAEDIITQQSNNTWFNLPLTFYYVFVKKPVLCSQMSATAAEETEKALSFPPAVL